jgi:6-phosphofructokinase 1
MLKVVADPVLRIDPALLQVRGLGECRFTSPLTRYVEGRRTNEHYVSEHDRVLVDDTAAMARSRGCSIDGLPTFEPGGPRARVFFEPGTVRAGIVTCGGLCPGLNDVIRGLVRELVTHYSVREIVGFRHGFEGLVPAKGHLPVSLTPESVEGINEQGGTVLGTSRGNQDAEVMVDRLVELGLDMLFVVGGDGSMKGAEKISREIRRRGLPLAVVVVPKTIDNDIPWIGQSFGFQTAFTVAARSVRAARVEAQASPNGVGLVKLMGRHSGFIACYAALASHAADFVVIPEVDVALDGPTGLLASITRRVERHGSAVVVVAEGAGQEWLRSGGHGGAGTDASGNARLADVGLFLKDAITTHFAGAGLELNLKYLDPSYAIRSVPAEPADSVYCIRLAQTAVHAAMAGRTDLMVGRRHNRFIHVPFAAVTARNLVATDGDLWLAVLESTEQPFAPADAVPV